MQGREVRDDGGWALALLLLLSWKSLSEEKGRSLRLGRKAAGDRRGMESRIDSNCA